MRFKKIALIMPPFDGENSDNRGLLLGVAYISQYLLDNNISNKVFDMRLGYTTEELKKWLNEYKPDLVSMPVFTNRFKYTYDLIKEIKSDKYKILLGGYHVSTIGSKIMEEVPETDYAIKVEGEEPMLELCIGKDLSKIDNLIFRKNGKIVENPTRLPITNLDKFNFPHYESFEFEKYDQLLPICSSRGCPHFCTFCTTAVCAGRSWRVRSSQNVIEEMKYWYDKGHRKFMFIDDNFTLLKIRVMELCDLIEKNKLTGLQMRCAGIRADRVDREVLTRMKEVGFNHIGIGVEVGNDKMFKIIRKGERKKDIEKALKLITELGYDVQLYFVIGNQYETESDVEDSFNLALKYPVSDAHFYNPLPFPGSELYDFVTKNGYFLEDFNDYINNFDHYATKPVFATPELSAEDRTRLLLKSRDIQKTILRNYYIRKMKPSFGILSTPLAYLVSFNPIRNTIISFFKLPIGKLIIRYLMDVFKIDIRFI